MNEEPQDPSSRPKPRLWQLAAAFAAIYVIWGSTYLAIRYGIETFPPFLMAGSRFALAGALLYGFARLRGAARPNAAQWRDAAVCGALMLMIGNGGVTWAEKVIPSGVAALLVALVPLWMVLVDWMRPRGKRPNSFVFGGLAIGFVGVALLARDNGGNGGTTYSWAIAALIAASICWAIGSVFSKHAQKPASPIVGVGMQMMTGGAMLLLIAGFTGEFATFSFDQLSSRSIGAWVYLTTAGSLIGFPAYVWLLQVTTPARVATYAYVNPFVAVLLGCTLGNETFSSAMFLAGALIIVAVVLIVCSGSISRPSRFKFSFKVPALLGQGRKD